MRKKIGLALRAAFFWFAWIVWGVALLTAIFLAGHLWGDDALTYLYTVLQEVTNEATRQ